MNSIVIYNLSRVEESPIEMFLTMPTVELAKIQNDITDAKRWIDGIKDIFDRILKDRFGDRAYAVRSQANKPEGIIRFVDGDCEVVSDIKNTVSWDQGKLSQIVYEIKESGENPLEYVRIKYEMMDTKYKNLPSYLRKVFEPARTMKPGRPSFVLNVKE